MTTSKPGAASTGLNLIAGRESGEGTDTYTAVYPRTGESGPVEYREATDAEVMTAVAAAAEAAESVRDMDSRSRTVLLRGVAEQLEGLGDTLLSLADDETALGEARLKTERARTCAQLRAFADVVNDGLYLDAIIDPADPDAQPVPRPDLRRMVFPLGPVAVFGASNFPLAFSVPGGDTAAALAAGCPVVAKAHPAHPGTSELAGRAIRNAVRDAGLPDGMFSMVHGLKPDVGQTLVTAPQIQAVGFTGSHAVGKTLFDLAASRPVPIPVYAEMSSINPVFVTSGALARRAEQIATGFVGSMTMGTGQFCTKPGLVFVPDDDAGFRFVDHVADAVRGYDPDPMLSARVRDALGERLAETAGQPGVETVVQGPEPPGAAISHAAAVLTADWETFRATPALTEEHFGPVAVIIRCSSRQMREAVRTLDGQLTGTVHAEENEVEEVADLLEGLRGRAGRLIWNGFPTGVAVTAAMHHGGPYPATTNPLHTSVGATAIRRFLRPVAFQNTPQALLPPALRDDNPTGTPRLVNGEWTDGPVR